MRGKKFKTHRFTQFALFSLKNYVQSFLDYLLSMAALILVKSFSQEHIKPNNWQQNSSLSAKRRLRSWGETCFRLPDNIRRFYRLPKEAIFSKLTFSYLKFVNSAPSDRSCVEALIMSSEYAVIWVAISWQIQKKHLLLFYKALQVFLLFHASKACLKNWTLHLAEAHCKV